ncbi:hypothetical protein DVH24_032520, partial [Malus domestica]
HCPSINAAVELPKEGPFPILRGRTWCDGKCPSPISGRSRHESLIVILIHYFRATCQMVRVFNFYGFIECFHLNALVLKFLPIEDTDKTQSNAEPIEMINLVHLKSFPALVISSERAEMPSSFFFGSLLFHFEYVKSRFRPSRSRVFHRFFLCLDRMFSTLPFLFSLEEHILCLASSTDKSENSHELERYCRFGYAVPASIFSQLSPFLIWISDFATAVAWAAGKLLVMERVKVAPPKAMEMRVKVKYTSVYHTKLYFCRRFGFPSQCSKTKNYPQLLLLKVEEFLRCHRSTMYIQLRKRPRHQPVQKLLIRLIADSTTNEHHNFKLDVGMVQDSRPKIAALPKPWWIPDTVHQLLYISQHRNLTQIST